MPEAATEEAEKDPATSTQPAGAAFFDVDNTMMRGASLFHVARKMYQRRAFRMRDVAGFAWKQILFSVRGENMNDVHSIRESALAFATGIAAKDIETLGDEVYDEMIASRIWPGTRALANQHVKAGRKVWLVTGTPIEVARVIAERLELTGALGTVGEISDGFYTGKLVGDFLHGPAKAVAVETLARTEGLMLAECWAYSDSFNDVPLLSIVGHPVAINPDSRLRRHARDNNWPVYDFRSGRRAATLGLRTATGAGIVYGAWKSLGKYRRR